MILPRTPTPLTELRLAEVLRDGHVRAFDERPDEDTRLAIAWAQCALEHARGKAVWCNNIGNVTAGSRWTGDVYELRVGERVERDPDVWKTLTLRFRAHIDVIDGAADYWRLLARSFATALHYFDAGDPRQAAHALSKANYYTALEQPYATAMVELVAVFRRAIAPVLDIEGGELTKGEQAAIARIVDSTARMADDARAGVEGMLAFERHFGASRGAPALP